MTTPHHTAPLIGLSGKQFEGKDVLAQWLLENLPEINGQAWVQRPIAGAIKQLYSNQTGLSLADIEAHKPEHRPKLIALGNWGRNQDPDFWLKTALSGPEPKIISDVRLTREAELIQSQGGFLIRVNAPREIRAQRGTLVHETDATECDLDTYPHWHAALSNDSSPDRFYQQAQGLVAIIGQHFGCHWDSSAL